MGQVKVFISYAKEDIKVAEKLYHDLKDARLEPWMDTTKLLGGQRWQAVIRDAIKDSSYFLALLSENSVSKRGFIQKELKFALEELGNIPPDEIYIIPVRLDESEPKHNELKELHWIDIFPSYEEGLKGIYQVLAPVYKFRSEPCKLSEDNAKAMIKKYNFYDRDWNSTGDFKNSFIDNGDGTVTDKTTGLIWEKESSHNMFFTVVWRYLRKLNRKRFAGYSDWRLPTLEELASLLESKKVNGYYINPVFECKNCTSIIDGWYWTADKVYDLAWCVNFDKGHMCWYYLESLISVRAVRTLTG